METIGLLIDHGVESRYFLLSGIADEFKKKYHVRMYVKADHCPVLQKYSETYQVPIQVLPSVSFQKVNDLKYARGVSNARMRAKKLDIYSHSGKESRSKFFDLLFKWKIVNIVLNNFFRKLTRKQFENKVLQDFFEEEKLTKMYMLQYDSDLAKQVGVNCSKLGIDVYIVMNTLKTVYIDNFISFPFERLFVWSDNQRNLLIDSNPGFLNLKIVSGGSPYHTFLRKDDEKLIQKVIDKYNIETARPLIVYSLINENVFQTEYEIIKLINGYFNEAFLENERPYMIIRRNPFEESTEHIEKMKNLNNVILADQFWYRDAVKGWSIQDEEGEKEWKALLSIADLSMNIPSMSTIDSLMCGTPVVNIGFDAVGNFNSELNHIIKTPFVQDFEKSPFVHLFLKGSDFKKYIPILLTEKSKNSRESIITSIDISKENIPFYLLESE